MHKSPLWRSNKEYAQSPSMELLGYFLMILVLFNKEYTQKSSMEVLVHFLTIVVYI